MLFRLDKAMQRPTLVPVRLSTLEAAGWTEKDLENVLAERINDLVRQEQLMVIAQERPWKEEADILALDMDGTLFIFELKRWQSDKENLLQVIRYGQIFGQFNYNDLERLFRRYRQDAGVSLAAVHREYFQRPDVLPKIEFNQNQRFIVVTSGIDVRTLEAINYWQGKNLPIEALPYHVFELDGTFLLQFTSYSPTGDDYAGVVSHDYIVNTDVTYFPEAYKEMLSCKKAAAHFDRKTAVDGIQPRDRVFLYHTGVGVIAVGRATSGYQEGPCRGEPGEEHYVPLKLEMANDPITEKDRCVAAWEINQAVGASYRFRQTAFHITKEMGDQIESMLREKRAGKNAKPAVPQHVAPSTS